MEHGSAPNRLLRVQRKRPDVGGGVRYEDDVTGLGQQRCLKRPGFLLVGRTVSVGVGFWIVDPDALGVPGCKHDLPCRREGRAVKLVAPGVAVAVSVRLIVATIQYN